MHPYRSFLFVPGQKPDWVTKAIASGADAIILDLEDSVPDDLKAQARQIVRTTIDRLSTESARPGIFVRPNALATGLAGEDLEAVVGPGVDGLLLPMVRGRDDVLRWSALVDWFERRNKAANIRFMITVETVQAIENCREIASASPRVASIIGQSAKSADLAREVGYHWTLAGAETLYLRSRVLLACREFGLHPVTALWEDIEDLDGLRSFSRSGIGLGYRGQIAIHPLHIQPINEIYSPSEADIEFHRGLVTAFVQASARGDGAAKYRGAHVDRAHAETSKAWLQAAELVLRGPQNRQGD